MQKNAIDFIPPNLQNQPFYIKMCELIDWLIENYYQENLDRLQATYNAKDTYYDESYILKLLGAESFRDVLFLPYLSLDEKRLSHFISRLFTLKGTNKGMELLMRLLGLEGIVYEWYEINEKIDAGDPLWAGGERYSPCRIAIEVIVGSWPVVDEYEEKFYEFASLMLWTCVVLEEIVWKKVFEDEVPEYTDEIAFEKIFYLADTYLFWDGSYEYIEYLLKECGLPDECEIFRIGDVGFVIGEGTWSGGLNYTCGDPEPVIIGTGILCSCTSYITSEVCWEFINSFIGYEGPDPYNIHIEDFKEDIIEFTPYIGDFIIGDVNIGGIYDYAEAIIEDYSYPYIGDGWLLGEEVFITDSGFLKIERRQL